MNRSVVLALATALGIGCAREHAPPAPSTPVRVHTAAPTSAAGGLRYSATIQPREQVSLAFRVGGYVRHIHRVRGADGMSRVVQPGDNVARGTVLARVREADYTQSVREARAALLEAEASAERYRFDLERANRLYSSESLTKPEWEAAQASSKAADARVKAAAARVANAATSLADTAIRAPFTGVVLSRSIEEGSLVAVGTVGFVIADTAQVKAVFGVPDQIVAGLALGDRLTVTAEAAPGRPFPGILTALSPSADRESRVFDAEVTIPNREGALKSGLIAAIEISPKKGVPAMRPAAYPAVPLAAVVQSPKRHGSYAVFVVDENGGKPRALAREVKLGEIAGNDVTILEGLRQGERVIVSGASLLTDQEPVRVVP